MLTHISQAEVMSMKDPVQECKCTGGYSLERGSETSALSCNKVSAVNRTVRDFRTEPVQEYLLHSSEDKLLIHLIYVTAKTDSTLQLDLASQSDYKLSISRNQLWQPNAISGALSAIYLQLMPAVPESAIPESLNVYIRLLSHTQESHFKRISHAQVLKGRTALATVSLSIFLSKALLAQGVTVRRPHSCTQWCSWLCS